MVAEGSYNLLTTGLWAQDASTDRSCNKISDSSARVIPCKDCDVIISKIFQIRISIFGHCKQILSDNGVNLQMKIFEKWLRSSIPLLVQLQQKVLDLMESTRDIMLFWKHGQQSNE